MKTDLFHINFLFGFILIVFSVVYFILGFAFNKKSNKFIEMDGLSRYLLCIAFLIVVYAFIAPSNLIDFYEQRAPKGVTGINYEDLVKFVNVFSGAMSPFIAISAVIITGLAFNMQFKANLLVMKANEELKVQFGVQQFESQFYKMLELHKENVNEIEMKIVDKSKNSNVELINGRKVFDYYIQEFHLLLSKISKSDLRIINEMSFGKAFSIFFHGLPAPTIDDLISTSENTDTYFSVIQEDKHNDSNKFVFDLYKGHDEYIAHYYRHLYMTVRFVVENKSIHNNTMKYLKVLRAQLSNAEQVMLFYNWIAGGSNGYGADWENIDNKYGNNKFFTEYYMIKNLPFDDLYDIYFIRNKVRYLYRYAIDKNKIFEQDVEIYLDKKYSVQDE